MRIAVFDTHPFDRAYFEKANQVYQHLLTFFEPRLTEETVPLARGFDVICSFVNDRLNEKVLSEFKSAGGRLVALRSVGYNHVDLEAAARLSLPVIRVPSYSPNAVAEHAVALILSLDRKTCRASSRVKEGNFSLNGLVGFDLVGKTVGVLGTGRIGSVMARIMNGFGCNVLAYDTCQDPALASFVRYEDRLSEILRRSDIISLHLPLTPETRHLIDAKALAEMKRGVMLINTSRGALIDSHALVDSLKSGQVGFAGLDVYEEEEGLFFRDLSDQVIQDDVLARLLGLPNVLVTSHQGFLTQEALTNIAETTLRGVSDFERGGVLENVVRADYGERRPA